MFVDGTYPGAADSSPDTAAGCGEVGNLPLEHLEHEIETLAAHINAGSCRWLELVAEFDRREGWGTWGCRSCAEWISWRCAIAPRAAREHVRVARRLGELSRITAAFRTGELSYSKVRALTRVADPANEEMLLEIATHATAAQLERIVRGYRRATREEANLAHERAYLDWHWDEDGSLRISGRLPPEDGTLLLRALEEARDALSEQACEQVACERQEGSAEPVGETVDGGSAEPLLQTSDDGSAEPPSPPRPTRAQALAAVAESALAGGPTPLSGGKRCQVVVHVDADTLIHGNPNGRCQLDDGISLSSDTMRRIGCDASVISILERDGRTLGVGRKTRSIPPSLRRALESRDRTCRFPGCERRRFTDAHHIKHWSHGGETNLENLVLLCRHHHRLLHEGGYSIERTSSGGISFRHPRGWPIPISPRPPGSDPRRLSTLNRALGLKIDGETCLTGSGERMDLGWVVASMCAKPRQPARERVA
jgi:uncharacterized protein YciI